MMTTLLTGVCALEPGGERYQASDEESNHEVYAPLYAIDPNARLRVYIFGIHIHASDDGLSSACLIPSLKPQPMVKMAVSYE